MKNKIRFLWQMFTYYMCYSFIMVFLAKPIDMATSIEVGKLVAYKLNQDAWSQFGNIIVLVFCNVITDLVSLTFTFIHLSKVITAFNRKNLKGAFGWTSLDLFIASSLFIVSQIISNHLYPMSIEVPPVDFTPFSWQAAFMPYAFMEAGHSGKIEFFNFVFPGQIFITGTVFLPTLVGMSVVLSVIAILFISRFFQFFQKKYLENIPDTDPCSPNLVISMRSQTRTRSDRCLDFAVHSAIITTITGTLIGGLLLNAILRLIGWG